MKLTLQPQSIEFKILCLDCPKNQPKDGVPELIVEESAELCLVYKCPICNKRVHFSFKF